jgi:UDP-glucuronate decarboxylase
VYGDPLVHPQPEHYWGNVSPNGVRSCYDEGKRCAETLFEDYRRQHNLQTKIVRIFNTYGPRMLPGDGRVVSNFILQALRGDDITIYGKGLQTRSFCYVDDLIDGVTKMMSTGREETGPINLGNPSEITVRSLAGLIIDLTGSKSQLKFMPLPEDDPRQRCPDISRAIETLGWRPNIPLRTGCERTIAYFDAILRKPREVMPCTTALIA